MNTLRYDGTLYKKYKMETVFEVITQFAAANCLTVEIDQNYIEVFFPLESEGIFFRFEGSTLLLVTTKHDVLENRSERLIYELLHHLKKYFSRFDVDDDYGIWANLLYEKYPTHIPLRELTKEEGALLHYIDYEGCTDSFQVLFGIISLYIGHLTPQTSHEKAKDNPINWYYLAERSLFADMMPIWVEGVIETWIYTSMEYKSKGAVKEILGVVSPTRVVNPNDMSPLQRKVHKEMFDIAWGISTRIVDFYGGTTGKKMVDILRFYDYEEEIFNKKTGSSINKDPEMILRFVLSCLNFYGYHIIEKPRLPKEKMVVREILYDDMV
ncbi:hypothetical protein LAD12857_15980 [Lacrimispora amygdalina]|uniref:Uncharacterized protein n=1 Tax=Lacrimispora amygdalina TaxID=253257 RepID=A0ABQ5M576_9FIRM